MLSRERMEQFIPEQGAKYDVIVCGGGPAGIGAALAASINGAKTLLIEGRGFFGGVAGVALWMPMNRLLVNGKSRGGVHNRFVEKIRHYGEDASVEGKKSWVDGDGLHIHPDYLKIAVFELLEEADCHYRLHSSVTDVIKEGNDIKGVVVTGKDGHHSFYANVVIDTTGDGDVAYLAGAEMVKGREEDGVFMPISLVFALANVDIDKLLDFTENHGDQFKVIIEEARNEGYTTSIFYSFDRTTIPGVVSVNNGGMHGIGSLDGTSVKDLIIAERGGIQIAIDFVEIARSKKIPGLENCYLMRTGGNVGVRETRRIVGDYTVTVEDAINGPQFEDVVARRYGAIDPGGMETEKDYKTVMKSGHAYPYRSLLPRGIEYLLVAGRCGSTTQLGQAAGKSMGNMMDLGQAAGVAAALASSEKVTPRQLDVRKIQDRLISMGVNLFNN
ncbi:MAG: FAD-dependent oxidoreductase [Paenibacillaceae bacterium]